MAFITKEYVEALKKINVIDNSDVARLHDLTKEKNFRNGKGYSKNHIRNFLYHQHTTTDEMVMLIVDYFTKKQALLKDLARQQETFVKQVQEEVA